MTSRDEKKTGTIDKASKQKKGDRQKTTSKLKKGGLTEWMMADKNQ